MKNLRFIFSLMLLICCSNIALADNMDSDVKAGYQTNVTQGRLLWSGINWQVYTQMENSTWVDDQGRLHMKLQKVGDRWYGTELDSPTTYLYGKFIWNVSSTSLQFERNTSIGFFTYTDDSHEIDFEIHQWPGLDPRLWFTNQPGSLDNHPNNVHYSVYSDSPYLDATNVTYTFDWEPTYINYSVLNSDGSIISSWNYTNAREVPHVAANVIENIGTVMGCAPVSGQPQEIIFNEFQYLGNDSIINSDVDFYAFPLSGTAPLTVTFIDLSKNAVAWNWDFGDGCNSTDQSPVHTYSSAGNYTVNLTVCNANGTDSKTSEINVKNSPIGPFAYITIPGSNIVSVIDTATNNVTDTVNVGNQPWGVASSRDGKWVFVTNVFSNTVSVIDTATNTVAAIVNGFYEPWGIAVSPDGKKAYVANSASSKVSAIDTATNTVSALVTVGNSPRGVVVIPDGTKVYVTNQNSDNVSVIGTVTNKVITTVDVGSQPWGVAVSPDGTMVYVANYGSSTVSVIDAATNNVSDTVHVGHNPVGVAVTPDGKKAYVTNFGSNNVSVIDTATGTVTTTISVGNTPYGVAFTPDGKKAYVANLNSNTVSVIDTSTNAVIDTVDAGKSAAFGQFIVPPLVQSVPPLANFSSNVTCGYEPISVQFTDLSENATRWNWDFGDGANSTDQSPVHTYSEVGTCIVNLTATNANGTDSKLATIKVLEQPILPAADFSTNASNGFAPLSLQFNDNSENSTEWGWDFGDGSCSSEQNPVHTYSSAGNYTVDLIVSNANGTDSMTSEINVKNSPIGPFAYITNSGNRTVSVIDTATNDITATVNVGNHPWGVAVRSDGKVVYVTNVYNNNVSVIDTATNTVKATVNGFKEPWGVAVTPDGKMVYVANSASNKVSVIDAATNTIAETVIVGTDPRGVAVTPDGKTVYVTNQNNNNVSVIDTVTNKVITNVDVGSQPWGVSISPDGTKVHVANYGSSTVSVIDAATNFVSATVHVGHNPVGIAFTPDGTKAYVTNFGSNNVSVIDTATGTVTTIISVGNKPYGVAFTPDGKKAYVANQNSNTVSVIDTATNTVIATVDAGNPVAFGKFIVTF